MFLLKVGNQQADNTLFRVHSFFFVQDSSWFWDNLTYPMPPGETTKGSCDTFPFPLKDITMEEFERFLWVFYNPFVFLRSHSALIILTSIFQKVLYL
jgi:hypothetical protein